MSSSGTPPLVFFASSCGDTYHTRFGLVMNSLENGILGMICSYNFAGLFQFISDQYYYLSVYLEVFFGKSLQLFIYFRADKVSSKLSELLIGLYHKASIY